ncbi:MAG: M14 family metallocarboxypeptidase [Clostridia bacterium]|nr:M14 family metallocarboxypeptidase [Clostridia bacterium]
MQINSISEYFDHKNLEKTLIEIKNQYEFLEVGTLGNSIFGKNIPRLTLGKGKKSVIYIGAHHGMEWITSALLIQFVSDFCKEYKNGTNIFDVSTRVLFETRKIHIVPMLNPDGVDYAIHGVNEDNVIYNRLIKMNDSTDFSHWQANARGVDLNHNYNAGFEEYKIVERIENINCGATKYSGEYPESEPETRALCNFVRFERPELALTLHTQGEEIYYTSGEKSSAISLSLAKTISRLTGYKISFPSGTAKYGGFTDWFIEEFDKPSFTLECGLGENPLPFSDFEKIYYKIKRALFIAPILI